MRGRNWTGVGVTAVLLLSEVVVAQLSKSPITLLDAFHTLYLLLNALSMTHTLLSATPREAPTHPPPDIASNHKDVDYRAIRARPVGIFISNLVLLSLNVIYLTEIGSFMLKPSPAQRPLLLVTTGAVSVVVKLSLLGLQWCRDGGGDGKLAAESYIEINSNALSAEERVEAGQDGGFNNNEPNGLNPDSSQNNIALTIRNTNLPNPRELLTNEHEQHSNNQTPANVPPPPSQPETRPSTKSLKSPWPHIGETIIIPSLVLITGLVTLSLTCLQNSKLCHSLVYLDPVLSLLAVGFVFAKAIPPVLRYGLLLLQGAPSHFSVDEVGKKIMDVPGVKALHELHVWKLTETFIVASVHVHCDASLQNRCVDVMLGVTKVLQREGVRCCTVQPEFIDYEPSLQLCGLTCAEACAASMCCSHLAKQHKNITNGRTKEESRERPEHITSVI